MNEVNQSQASQGGSALGGSEKMRFIYVYILYSSTLKKKYIGITKDLKNRLEHHNLGLDRWSKRGIPWKLIYYEAYLNKTDAYRREKFLKSGKGRELTNNRLKEYLKNL